MADRVNKLDRALFRKALIEVFAEKYDEALADDSVDESCSVEHEQAMKEIAARAVKSDRRKIGRKWLVAILVAASLLLSACAAYVCRGEIRDFIERVYDKYIRVAYHEENEVGNDGVISDYYTLGCVPSGYKLSSHIRTTFINKYQWESSDGEILIFEQYSISVVNYSIDSEQGESSVLICGRCEVYRRVGDMTIYIWNDGVYAYKIQTSKDLPFDVVDQIVNGLVVAK